jgi:type II secretory ATPase GspE/PulE/Tfp pilus assembly ATPase PilB-like protein
MIKNENILGEILVKKGIITSQALSQVQETRLKTFGKLIPTIISLNLAKEDPILRAVAEELNLPIIRLRDTTIEDKVIKKVPVRFAVYYRFMPIKLISSSPDASGKIYEQLTIAVPYPLDIRTRDELRLHLGLEIEMVLSPSDEIIQAIKKYYGFAADTLEKMTRYGMENIIDTSISQAEEKVEDIELAEKTEDASVIKLVNQIMLEAHNKRATDIHIEPYRGKLKLRYRVDGIIYNTNIPPAMKKFYPSILSRIKIMSNLNIVERRLPQDGRCIIKTEKETFDMRVSIIPTPWGESIVIRLLPTKMLYSLSELGLEPDELSVLTKLLDKPHGIIFVTGPTGSGKTTTLYASLSRLNTPDVKILTIEDPIEYELEGITQIQVMPEIGLTFARGLRSMLRHDPDIMMVGEVRDFETAEITIRIALTGHLIFSTLHTNDAASSVTRLIDMGIEPYLISSSVESFIAQRLVRTICPHCKIEDTMIPVELVKKEFNLPEDTDPKTLKIYKGRGCDNCNSTGYLGRTAIYEILLVDDKIRKLVISKSPSDEIKISAMKSGMKTLRQSGYNKMITGLTTFDEVTRITPADPSIRPEIVSAYIPKLKTEPVAVETARSERSETEIQRSPTREPQPKTETADTPMNIGAGRVYKRLSSRIPLEYTLYKISVNAAPEKQTKTSKAMTVDVSATGILFETNEPLLIGSILRLKIFIPSIPTIEALTRVQRVEVAKSDDKRSTFSEDRYWASCYYLDIETSAKSHLDTYIQQRT